MDKLLHFTFISGNFENQKSSLLVRLAGVRDDSRQFWTRNTICYVDGHGRMLFFGSSARLGSCIRPFTVTVRYDAALKKLLKIHHDVVSLHIQTDTSLAMFPYTNQNERNIFQPTLYQNEPICDNSVYNHPYVYFRITPIFSKRRCPITNCLERCSGYRRCLHRPCSWIIRGISHENQEARLVSELTKLYSMGTVVGLNMLPSDCLMSCLDSLLGYSTGEFQAL